MKGRESKPNPRLCTRGPKALRIKQRLTNGPESLVTSAISLPGQWSQLRGTDSGFWDPEYHVEKEEDKEAGEECKKMYLQKIDMHKKTAHEVLDDWLQLQQQRYAVIWVNGSWNRL